MNVQTMATVWSAIGVLIQCTEVVSPRMSLQSNFNTLTKVQRSVEVAVHPSTELPLWNVMTVEMYCGGVKCVGIFFWFI